jgi:hypothetical protein
MYAHGQLRVRGTFGFGSSLILGLATLLIAFPVPSYSQLSSGTITGVVRDSTGAVVLSAELVLRNVETTVERRTVTNNAGNYTFTNVTPGRYTMKVSATGFRLNQVAEFIVAVNQTLTIDSVLEVGNLEQTVQVEAQAEQLQSSTAELGAVVAEKQVADLPLNGRNFTQLLSLTPGVAPVSVSQNSGGFGAITTAGAQFQFPAINGQTNRSNFFMTDGINNQAPFTSTYAVAPIIDTIQEFKVVSHNDQAEFGSSLGGIINVVTKSGTNGLHGTAFEFVRNDAFDARNTYFDKVQTFKQNEFGFSVGGPVILPKIYNGKNKTFFYGAFQQFLYRSPANSFFRVPTEANYNGDLSDIPTQIYNPFSTREDPAHPGNFLRDPFPNNQIPANLINPQMVAFAKATLPAAGPKLNGNNNALDSTPFHQDQREYTFRVDQSIRQSDFIWFRYSSSDQNNTQSGGRPALRSLTNSPAENYGLSWVHTFSPTTVMQAQYGRSHAQNNNIARFQVPANFAQTIGFADSFASGFIGGKTEIPNIAVDGFFSGGETDGLNPNLGNIHQYQANVTKILGKHTLKWGGEYSASTFEAIYLNASTTFSAQQTGNPSNSAEPGSSLASFLLNVPDQGGRRNVHETTRPGGVMSFYVQDSWKFTPKLTVNIGLRYDRSFLPPYGTNETIGQNGGIETGAINFNNGTYTVQKLPPPCSERGHSPCIPGDGTLPEHVVVDPRGKIYHDTTKNFGPRIGFAYRLGQKTAIRSGFGIVWENWAAVTQTAQNYEGVWPDLGQQLANNLNKPSSSQLTPTITGQNPFGGVGAGLFPAPTPFNQVQWYMDPYSKNPYSLQWNFGVQHQLNEATVVNVNYVGSGSRRLDVGGYYNTALTPGPGDPQSRSLYPYIAPTFYDRSIGKGSYHALQFQFERRYSVGLAYQVAYTWSKSMDIGSSGWYGVEGQSVTDPYHIERDRSVSAFDLTHVLSLNMLYDLPIGKGKRFSTNNGVLDYILGNWQFNNVFLARSGTPYNVYVSGDVANTGNVGWAQYERANLVGDPHLDHPTWNEAINRAAFQIPAQYTFGNLGRNRLRTPGFWNLDTSLFRAFPIREWMKLEFRFEAFNIFNTVIYGQPVNDMADTANFGKVLSTANSPRQLQLGAKIIW